MGFTATRLSSAPASNVTSASVSCRNTGDGVGEDEYVAMREARDRKLDAPNLLLPSIQVNIRAGCLPVAESNGVRYLKIPVSLAAAAQGG